jgi:hypothetical protein
MISDGDMTIGANPSLLGTIRMVTGGNVYLDTDLRVDGSISSKSVTAEGRVDANGVSAGPLGFVSVFGGLSIGVPVAAPGNILCAGNISALPIPGSDVTGVGTGSVNGTFLNGVICNFGVSNSIWAFDQINTPIYNTHFHEAPEGPTSTPISLQVGINI